MHPFLIFLKFPTNSLYLFIVLCAADLWDTHAHKLSASGEAHGGLEPVVSIITNTTRNSIHFIKRTIIHTTHPHTQY